MATCKFFPKPAEILHYDADGSYERERMQKAELTEAYNQACKMDYDKYLEEMVRLGRIEGRPEQTIQFFENELYRLRRNDDRSDVINITPDEYAKLEPISSLMSISTMDDVAREERSELQQNRDYLKRLAKDCK